MSGIFDLAIVGGGVNGCGVARDAAGRGLKVLLCEQSDLGSGTSSAATKLIHGGLRYLEHYDFKLVRHALIAEPPSIDLGEITDKGSLNQRALLANRAADVEALYAEEAKPQVVQL